MDIMQTINWDLIKEKIQKSWIENNFYVREFKTRTGNIIQVTKYTHTDFKINIINKDGKIISSPKVSGPEECYNIIYKLMTE